MNESIRVLAPETSTRTELRRAALVTILEDRAEPILDRIVVDALRATDFVGPGELSRRATRRSRVSPFRCGSRRSARWIRSARGSSTTMRTSSGSSSRRASRSSCSAASSHGGFKAANGIARDGARAEGFEPDELEDELRVFQRAFEARLFFGL